MATFKNRCLAVLDRVYAFVSDRTYTTELNLDVPIALVHDTSREAELGSAWGRNTGYGKFSFAHSTAAANTTESQIDIYQYAVGGLDPTLDYREDDTDVWILGIDVISSNPGNVTLFSVTVNADGQYLPIVVESARALFKTIATTYFGISNYSATGTMYYHVNDPAEPPDIQLPMHVVRGERLCSLLQSGGAVNMNGWVYYWVGRKGTTPPGMR